MRIVVHRNSVMTASVGQLSRCNHVVIVVREDEKSFGQSTQTALAVIGIRAPSVMNNKRVDGIHAS